MVESGIPSGWDETSETQWNPTESGLVQERYCDVMCHMCSVAVML